MWNMYFHVITLMVFQMFYYFEEGEHSVQYLYDICGIYWYR